MSVSDHVSTTEDLFYRALRVYLPSLPFVTHYEAEWFWNPDTNRRMHLDVAWPDLKLALEVNGTHHYRNIQRFGDTSKQRVRDTKKRQVCADNGWLLLEADIHGLTEARMRVLATKITDRAMHYPAYKPQAMRDRSQMYLRRLPKDVEDTASRFQAMGIKRDIRRPYRKPGLLPLLQRTWKRLLTPQRAP